MAEGTELGVAGGLGFGFTAPRRGLRARIDRMYDVGYYEGGPHPSTPELRLKDMEMDGVDAEVLYGMTNAGMRIKDLDLLTTTYRIYNEWVVDFCNTRPRTLVRAGVYSHHRPGDRGGGASPRGQAGAEGRRPLYVLHLAHLHEGRLLGPALGGGRGDGRTPFLPHRRGRHSRAPDAKESEVGGTLHRR